MAHTSSRPEGTTETVQTPSENLESLVEVNQAIDAWSFRQGCNLPISHHSPKYKTETLIFNGDRKELFSTKKTVTYTRNFFLPKKCNIYKELFSTKKMF